MQGPLSLKNKMLSTPLLAKNSTPIRARITSNQTPANSTPINQLKLSTSPIINKENINTSNISLSNFNFQKRSPFETIKQNVDARQSGAFSKTITFGDCKFSKKPTQSIPESNAKNTSGPNLSPILALNRKMNQFQQSSTFTSNTFRSLTPNNNKKPEYVQSSSQQKIQPMNFKTVGILANQTLKQSTSNSDLRSSSSFSNLFQKRSKTPTRLGSMAFSSLSRKNNPSPGLKQDNSFRVEQNRYLSQKLKDSSFVSSKGTLNQSNSNIFGENEKMMCINNDGRTAKYRVKQSQENCFENEDIENLVYCSKCAIDLVTKGISFEELGLSKQTDGISVHTSPRDQSLRQSKSFKNSFLSFKTSYSSQMLERLKLAQKLKSQIIQELKMKESKKSAIQKKYIESMEDIDCYYNSVISYIEQERAKDKSVLETLKNKVYEQIFDNSSQVTYSNLEAYLQSLQQVLKSKITDVQLSNLLGQIQQQLIAINQSHQNQSRQAAQILGSNFKMIQFHSSIQDQFDEFVSYFDTQGKVQYKTFEEMRAAKPMSKNNALRFSFEKALQNQNRKKSLILDSQPMNTLQQESEEEYDQNSFSHDHMKQTAESQQGQPQKPFRTLFAEEDDILEHEQEEQNKNDMYSPTFKAI